MRRISRILASWRRVVQALIVVAIVALWMPVVFAADTSVLGSQGLDTAIPLTDSATSVEGRGAFDGLKITVNQTAQLTDQAISVTWTGAAPTIAGRTPTEENFLQIMQCWGDDDGTVPGNPGPPPEQCVQGAVAGVFGGLDSAGYPPGFSTSRIISRPDWENFDPNVGVLSGANVWRPFRSVTGEQVDSHTDPNFNPDVQGGAFWLNPFFNIVTTNEITNARTGADGKGAELFRVQTGIESSGLGCGQRVLDRGGSREIPKCWLVIVPRGTAVAENVGSAFAGQASTTSVSTSPLSPAAWANRIAIPLQFTPVDTPCDLGADERRIVGSELALLAVSSWQPTLCSTTGLPPYSYATISDAQARQQLTLPSPGSPGLVTMSKPIDPALVTADNPVVYAPLTVSGLGIGFNIQRLPDSLLDANDFEAVRQQAGVRIAELNLTPRLVAKLLTQSYRGQVAIIGAAPPGETWYAKNPNDLDKDPDFLRFNPEFALLNPGDQRRFGGLSFPAASSDAAIAIWEWIVADPEAAAFLSGTPDEFGMQVNPNYSTDAATNPTGIAFGTPLPATFPKADPYCFQAEPTSTYTPPPLCGADWMPYSRSFFDSAKVTREASDQARVGPTPTAVDVSRFWSREPPQPIGRQTMLSITDTPSAARFGVQMARLSRAGDNGADRSFIAPTAESLFAGVAIMEPRAEPAVLEPRHDVVAPGAYPLTQITYGATAPLAIDDLARLEYAAFVAYAVQDGQVPGLDLGELPPGYLPLPSSLAADAAAAVLLMLTLEPPPPAPEPTEPVEPPTPSTPPEGSTTTTSVPPRTPQVPTNSGSFPTSGGPSGGFVPSSNGSSGGFVPSSSGDSSDDGPTGDLVTDTVADTTPEAAPPTSDPSEDEGGEDEAGDVVAEVAEPDPADPALTPDTDVGINRMAVPAFGSAGLVGALAALEISRRPRRSDGSEIDDDVDPDPDGGGDA